MRDYGKVSPQFWTGQTGKALKAAGPESVVVGLYLMTSPHANMIGLYYLPVMYMAHETGLGMEGASKGLQGCIEASFCTYDSASEYVFVHAMARYQVAESLKPDDKRCKGIDNELSKIPKSLLVKDFLEMYGERFHLSTQWPFEGASKPLRSQEQEQKQEQEQERHAPAGANPPPKPKKAKTPERTFPAWVESIGDDDAIRADDPIFDWASKTGVPADWIGLAWWVFEGRYSDSPKKYADWRAVFRKAVREDWLKVWRLDTRDNRFVLTTTGELARREMEATA